MKIEGTKTCHHGHDLTLPGAWAQINPNGTHGQCRECRCAWQRKRGARYTQCRECGKQHPPSSSTYCSSKCQRLAAARDHAQSAKVRRDRRDSADATLAILRLTELRERAATHWEREEITARLEALRA